MATSSEINSLFATLASNLQNVDPTSGEEDGRDSLSHTVANLNRSLNLTETHPSVRILDTALSLMCFTASQVYESLIEDTVNTIVAVLSSSVQCKVLNVGEEEVLHVGGSISSQDCMEVVQACADILEKLDGRRDLSSSLLYAVARMAVLASHFECALGSNTSILDFKYFDGGTFSFGKILGHIPKELIVKSGQVPLRLMLWYLDSAMLKHDVSQILLEANQRPLLCLNMEFHERTEWRSLIICFALAPAVFVEARALLHDWFLLTGLASVMKLQNELVNMVLDIVSQPMSWGLSEEIGSKLPFSMAYFPYPHQLLRTFAGPLSWESLKYLLHKVSLLPYGEHFDTTDIHHMLRIKMVDHKSMWATAMNFPVWIYFASMLLFSTPGIENRFCLKSVGSPETCELKREGVPYSAAAARFIAWLLSPTSKSCQDVLVGNLSKISVSWTSKHLSSKKRNKVSNDYEEVGEPGSNHQGSKTTLKFGCHTILIWLREFHDMCLRYVELVAASSCEVQTSQAHGSQSSLLFRRIPLGILLGYYDFIDVASYELLLHYAATGTVFQFSGTQQPGVKHITRISGRDEVSFKRVEDAVAGVTAVFELTDAIENMAASLFETEDSGDNFTYCVKSKAGTYLHKCVERILQLQDGNEGRLEMFRDAYNGMARWRLQGPDVFQDHKDLNDVFQRLSCLSESSKVG